MKTLKLGTKMRSIPVERRPLRVQIPAYTDRWMMGDRYGEVIATLLARVPINGDRPEIAVVRLDKSGKLTRVLLDDCTPV